MVNNDVLIKLNPKFQRLLFSRFIKKYEGSLKASKIIGIPAGSIRGYKNLYFEVVPKVLLDKLVKLKITGREEIEENKLGIISRNSQINNSLSLGREFRKRQLEAWRENIPSVREIVDNNKINLERWFFAYRKLIDFGSRSINYINKKGNFLVISYNMHSGEERKEFVVKLPREIKIDDDFSYFLGLWCGDRAGGKRFGITNQNPEIISYTEKFLKKFGQNIEKILYIKKGLTKPKIEYDKEFVFNKDINGWVLSVHSTNGILASFFHYLQRDINYLIRNVNKSAFFAGLFDAEGNVSLYNKSLRWACKNEFLVEIYSKILLEMDMFKRYDGGCLVCYNVNKFCNFILPYMKHSKKTNLTNLLFGKGGTLPERHKLVLEHIKMNPSAMQSEVAKALKEKKVYSELGLLKSLGYIQEVGYPFGYYITPKGNKLLGEK